MKYLKKNTETSVLSALIILGLLAGCSNVRAPEQNLNERLQFNQEVASRYQLNDKWWTIYQDAQLNQLVQTALDNNIDLAKSAINVNKALYQANLLGADLVPSFSGKVTASTSKNVKTSEPSSRSFGGNLSLSYELDLWRKLADSADAQQWEYKASIEDLQAAKLTLINNVVDAYYHLAYLQGAIGVAEQNISYYQKIVNLTQIKHKSGKIDSHNTVQANQSLLSARNSLLDLQTQRKNTEQTLRNLLNLKPGDSLDDRYPDLLKVNLTQVDLNVPLSVLANRPDLRAAEFRLQKAFKNARASEKSWYPGISLGAALNTSSDHAKSAFNVPFTSGNVGISLPFLQWNTIKWNVKLSEAEYESTRLNFEQALTTALNEVDTYNNNYRNTRATLDNITKKYALDSKNSQYYKIRYQNGANELSDWLDALNTENTSRQSVLNNRYQIIQQENMIYKAMGGRHITTSQ